MLWMRSEWNEICCCMFSFTRNQKHLLWAKSPQGEYEQPRLEWSPALAAKSEALKDVCFGRVLSDILWTDTSHHGTARLGQQRQETSGVQINRGSHWEVAGAPASISSRVHCGCAARAFGGICSDAYAWESVSATCPTSNTRTKSVNMSLSRMPGVLPADTHTRSTPLTVCPFTRLKWRWNRGPFRFNPPHPPPPAPPWRFFGLPLCVPCPHLCSC